MTQVLCLSILILSIFQLNNASPVCLNDTNCPATPCMSYNTFQIVENLWNLPQIPPTPLLTRFKNEILQHIQDKCVTERQFSVLVGQTEWAVNILTNFDPTLSLSCVFDALIHESNGVYDGNCKHALNRAIKTVEDLTLLANVHAVDVGLSASGCSSAIESKRNPAITCPLNLDTLFKSLKISTLYIPDNLSLTIKHLLKSSCVQDQLVGLSAVAIATETGALLYYKLYQTQTFLKMLRIQSCPIPVADNCCGDRKHLLYESASLLRTSIINNFNNIIYQNEE
ncbi:uncharacterized protein LOC143918200 [Arctopsyche grandis]|uniref:uncharacterized protein LOC143918200 n=1 Tax=Arctopsyche grandis TaxID=121162 RepID=UPI00406D7E40